MSRPAPSHEVFVALLIRVAGWSGAAFWAIVGSVLVAAAFVHVSPIGMILAVPPFALAWFIYERTP